GGVVEIHDTGGGGLDAHLLLQSTAHHTVTLTDTTLIVGQELGYDEQRNAAGAFGGIRQTGQHDVYDVLGQVVVAGGNKDLGTGQLVGAIRLRDGAGLDRSEERRVGKEGRLWSGVGY